MSNHLGNVLVTVSDKKIGVDANADGIIDYYNADVVTANDYYPFGMMMPERKFESDKAVYGFNGMRKDNEIYGEGNAYDFGARIYDSRLGWWMSIDKFTNKYPNVSPYAFCINSPIQFKDANGNWLVDKYGNIIYTLGDYVYEKNGKELVRAQLIYFYTNDGQKVEGRLYDSKTSISNVKFYDEAQKQYKDVINQEEIEDIDPSSPVTFNCHGYTLNGNPITLENGQLANQNTMSTYGSNVYFPGNDADDNDNISKIYKNDSEFKTVNSKDVQPGDVAIFTNEYGEISHSATVTNVGKRGRKVKLSSKDDRKPLLHGLTIKKIMRGNKTDFKKFVGYYRHIGNKEVDISVGEGGNAGDPDGEVINNVLKESKKE